MADRVFRERVRAGETVFGFITNLDSVDLVEAICGLGVDFVVIDSEHGPLSIDVIRQMLQVTRRAPVAGLIRVPHLGSAYVSWAMDLGADGFVFPHVEEATSLHEAIEMTRYPPDGTRGLDKWTSAAQWGATNTQEHIKEENEGIMVIAQIETRRGLEHAEEIVQVPGLDLVLVGTNDLAQSLGYSDVSEVKDAVHKVFHLANEAGIRFGSGGDLSAQVRDQTQTGATFILAGVGSTIISALREVTDGVQRALTALSG